ncbi:MAG: GEVED domain-containing protein, partial [Planctomycetota bacterium]|nr:GEVED domain-containing protein [Planctomycetota bacterium]
FESFDEQQMAEAIAGAINGDSSLEGVSAVPRTDSVVVNGAFSVSGIRISLVSGIEDYAGNALYPNQAAGDTSFVINLEPATDWGDAPGNYPTTAVQNGANHLVADGFYLGSSVDTEADGQPDESYQGDDDNRTPDDEDGLININDDELKNLQPGGIYKLEVVVQGIGPARPGFLDAWIDFDHDESWDGFTGDHPTEIDPVTEQPVQVFVSEKLVFYSTEEDVPPIEDATADDEGNVTLVNGVNDLYFRVPPQANSSCPSLRIRLSSEGNLLPTGQAGDGEVEDYELFTQSSSWHNVTISEDVNQDGFVSPIDALLVINFLEDRTGIGKEFPNGQLLTPPDPGDPNADPPIPADPLVDVNDDGFVAPIDALRVVNFINAANGGSEGEGEGESMLELGTSRVTITSASVVAPVVQTNAPEMLVPERVRESQFADLDIDRGSPLDDLLRDIGDEVTDAHDADEGHDEFFASVRY